MPMRAFRASHAHVSGNFDVWMIGFGVLAAAFALGVWAIGGKGVVGDLFALITMIFAIFVMLRSQRGLHPVVDESEDDADEIVAAETASVAHLAVAPTGRKTNISDVPGL